METAIMTKINTIGWTDEDKIAKAVELREQNMKVEDIAWQFDVDKSTISRWLNKSNTVAQQVNVNVNLLQQTEAVAIELRNNLQQAEQREKQLCNELQELRNKNQGYVQQLATQNKDTQQLAQQIKQLQGDVQQLQEANMLLENVSKIAKQELKKRTREVATFRLKRRSDGRQLRAIFVKENVLIVFMILIALALAIGITAPVYQSAGIFWLVALALAFGTDFAGMIFIYRGVKWFEWLFAGSIILQVAIKLGIPHDYAYEFATVKVGSKMIGLDVFQITRAAIMAISLGISVYGLGQLTRK